MNSKFGELNLENNEIENSGVASTKTMYQVPGISIPVKCKPNNSLSKKTYVEFRNKYPKHIEFS